MRAGTGTNWCTKIGKWGILFEKGGEMKGIYSSCIGKETLDEAPFACRDLYEIETCVGDGVEIKKRLLPVYNFKAGNLWK